MKNLHVSGETEFLMAHELECKCHYALIGWDGQMNGLQDAIFRKAEGLAEPNLA
jgi:uncharacterized protein YjaZ